MKIVKRLIFLILIILLIPACIIDAIIEFIIIIPVWVLTGKIIGFMNPNNNGNVWVFNHVDLILCYLLK